MKYLDFIDNTKISKICFGTWNLSPSTKKFISPNTTTPLQSINLLRFALDKGINFFDTADIYGEGIGEKIIGKAFQNLRKEIIVITKSGVLNERNDTNFSKKYIEKKIKKSLTNLNTDYLDGYQFHNITSESNIDSSYNFLTKLKKKGKIRSIGFSSRDPIDAYKILKNYNFDFLQVGFSIFDQRLLYSKILELKKKKKFILLTRSPFNSGYLLKKKSNKALIRPKLQSLIDHFVKKNKKDIYYKNNSLAESALKFCISFPEISSIIIGMATKLEITRNINTMYDDLDLEQGWKKKLIKVYKTFNGN
tara:strand:+ start:694 stop:1614 length:921 start_codon:yes stop_codon:yes gene_type:complete